MKTVTGKILSTTPISLSKAATILSKFVSAETGASQAVGAYLQRATAAFDELVCLHSNPNHKKLKKHNSDAETKKGSNDLGNNVGHGSIIEVKEEEKDMGNVAEETKKKKKKEKQKQKKSVDAASTIESKVKSDFENNEDCGNTTEAREDKGEGNVAEDTKKKKRKEKSLDLSNFGDAKKGGADGIKEEQIHSEGNVEEGSRRKSHKKKMREKERERENGVENTDRMGIIKKKKNDLGSFEENGDKMEKMREKKENGKKRKSIEVAEDNNNEEDQHKKKKKKRKQ